MIYGERVLPKHENLKIIRGDIRNQELLKKAIPSHDCLIHLACISNDPSFELNPRLGKSINLDAKIFQEKFFFQLFLNPCRRKAKKALEKQYF